MEKEERIKMNERNKAIYVPAQQRKKRSRTKILNFKCKSHFKLNLSLFRNRNRKTIKGDDGRGAKPNFIIQKLHIMKHYKARDVMN